jgi:hypothetical protein
MNSVDKAVATQLANIEKRTGQSLAQLAKLVRASGLSKHGELVAMLKRDLGMGHGDANMLVHTVRQQDAEAAGGGAPATADDALAAIYSGKKAALRPIHDRLMAGIGKFGEFEWRRRRPMSACGAGSSSPRSGLRPTRRSRSA